MVCRTKNFKNCFWHSYLEQILFLEIMFCFKLFEISFFFLIKQGVMILIPAFLLMAIATNTLLMYLSLTMFSFGKILHFSVQYIDMVFKEKEMIAL